MDGFQQKNKVGFFMKDINKKRLFIFILLIITLFISLYSYENCHCCKTACGIYNPNVYDFLLSPMIMSFAILMFIELNLLLCQND